MATRIDLKNGLVTSACAYSAYTTLRTAHAAFVECVDTVMSAQNESYLGDAWASSTNPVSPFAFWDVTIHWARKYTERPVF